jgi:uncharacterized protein (DUF885 family)
MMDRRRLLASGAFAALAHALPAGAQTRATPAATSDPALTRLMDRLVAQGLQRSPRQATSLGLDVGALAGLRSRIEDRSLAAKARETAEDARSLAELRAIGRERLSGADRVGYDTIEFQLSERQRQAKFPYGAGFSAYTLTQQAGAYQGVPDFLDTQHPVKTAADADAYIARLEGYAAALDQETERFLTEVEAGAIPPDFVLDTTATQLRAQRGQAPDQATVVRSLARRAGEAGLSDSYAGRARSVLIGRIAPALERQIAAVGRVRPRAAHDAGIWRARDGEAYYAAKLKWYTTTDLTADQVHDIGLEQVAQITAAMDAQLKALGYTQGTVLQRLQALNVAPAQLYANDDAGRAQLLASLNAQMADLDQRLPRAFNRLPKAKVEIRRVPVEIQDGAANGYYQRASLDGSRPGAFYINLKNTNDWPKWALPTLTYHEANPGHHLQGTLLQEDGALHLYRRSFTGFSAYSEGWGLYSEQVADELGAYEAYPLGASGSCRPTCTGPCGWWWTPACITSAGAARSRSPTWSTTRDSRRRVCSARSTATPPIPLRPVATRSARPRSCACARRPSAGSALGSMSRRSTTWCWEPAPSR